MTHQLARVAETHLRIAKCHSLIQSKDFIPLLERTGQASIPAGQATASAVRSMPVTQPSITGQGTTPAVEPSSTTDQGTTPAVAGAHPSSTTGQGTTPAVARTMPVTQPSITGHGTTPAVRTMPITQLSIATAASEPSIALVTSAPTPTALQEAVLVASVLPLSATIQESIPVASEPIASELSSAPTPQRMILITDPSNQGKMKPAQVDEEAEELSLAIDEASEPPRELQDALAHEMKEIVILCDSEIQTETSCLHFEKEAKASLDRLERLASESQNAHDELRTAVNVNRTSSDRSLSQLSSVCEGLVSGLGEVKQSLEDVATKQELAQHTSEERYSHLSKRVTAVEQSICDVKELLTAVMKEVEATRLAIEPPGPFPLAAIQTAPHHSTALTASRIVATTGSTPLLLSSAFSNSGVRNR